MSSQKLSVYTIKVNGGITWNKVIEGLLYRNTEQERCIITEQSDTYVGGCYLLETYINQTQYNVDENRFELVPVKRLNIIKFDMFLNNSTLLLWGGKRAASAFLTAIETASNHQATIEYKDSDFKKMIGYLLKNPEVGFVRMKIMDVFIDQGILANCIVNLKGQENSRKLVEKYLNNISQISVLVGKDELSVSITIYSSGSVVVYRDRDELPDDAMNVINAMFGGVM